MTHEEIQKETSYAKFGARLQDKDLRKVERRLIKRRMNKLMAEQERMEQVLRDDAREKDIANGVENV